MDLKKMFINLSLKKIKSIHYPPFIHFVGKGENILIFLKILKLYRTTLVP